MATTKVNHPDLLDLASDTGATVFPKGTTEERPVSPEAGYIRFNTTDNVMETYDGAEWLILDAISSEYTVDYLVVAGGGGGGGSGQDGWNGGGGGAGGLRTSYGPTSGGGVSSETPLTLTPGVSYPITIGSGGARGNTGTNSGAATTIGSNGTDSIFSTIESKSGGGGGAASGVNNPGTKTAGLPGGSGGGSGINYNSTAQPGGSGTSGQGYSGGSGANGGTGFSGGGGGAGGAGTGPVTNDSGGVAGLSVSISGSSLIYSSGGNVGSPSGGNGANNTGDGGDGAYVSPSSGTQLSGNGGSGIVILRMLTANYSGITTGSPTITINGSDTILTYTSSGTYTA